MSKRITEPMVADPTDSILEKNSWFVELIRVNRAIILCPDPNDSLIQTLDTCRVPCHYSLRKHSNGLELTRQILWLPPIFPRKTAPSVIHYKHYAGRGDDKSMNEMRCYLNDARKFLLVSESIEKKVANGIIAPDARTNTIHNTLEALSDLGVLDERILPYIICRHNYPKESYIGRYEIRTLN